MAGINPHQFPEDLDEAGEGTARNAPYKPRKPRSMLVMLGAMLLLALLAIAGIIIAIVSASKDPSAIELPVHTTRSLAEEQPMPKLNRASPVPQTDISRQLLHEDIKHIENEGQQNDAPMQLETQSPVPPAEKPAILEPKKNHVSPQSMIIWDAPKFQTATKAVTKTHGYPQISIVIDDMGLNLKNSKILAAMQASLTLAYLPYAENLSDQTKAAYATGHELIVHMPMEPDDVRHHNPGPNALLSSLSGQENLVRLQHNLDQFNGYIGLNNHMGSKLTADPEALRPLLAEVKKRNLWFLDSKTIGNSIAGKIADEMGVPYAERDVFLDNVPNVGAITGQLKQLERIAERRGYAVAIGHPHDATIAALKSWLPDAQKRGFRLVPLSAIINARFPHAAVPRYARLEKQQQDMQHVAASAY